MFCIDLMKIPRPERSGYIAILVAYTLLWLWGYNLMPHDFSDNLKDFSVKCWIAPWACPKQPEQDTVGELRRHYHIVMLSPHGKGKKPCVCHIDLHYFGKANLHLRLSQEPTCDSDYTEPRKWTLIPAPDCSPWTFEGHLYTPTNCLGVELRMEGKSYFIKGGEAEYRYHCE